MPTASLSFSHYGRNDFVNIKIVRLGARVVLRLVGATVVLIIIIIFSVMPKLNLHTSSKCNAPSLIERNTVDTHRENICDMIRVVILSNTENHPELDTTSFLSLSPAVNIERGIYNSALQKAKQLNVVCKWSSDRFVDIYNQRVKAVLSNLDPASYVGNARLFQRLVTMEILPPEIAFMSPAELFPERWKEVHDKLQRKEVDYTPTAFVTL
jgi:hypothetical protein